MAAGGFSIALGIWPDIGALMITAGDHEEVLPLTWVEISPEARKADHILASHSLNREALDAHLRLYRTVMFGPSGLSRAEREAMAVCVSAANDCHY